MQPVIGFVHLHGRREGLKHTVHVLCPQCTPPEGTPPPPTPPPAPPPLPFPPRSFRRQTCACFPSFWTTLRRAAAARAARRAAARRAARPTCPRCSEQRRAHAPRHCRLSTTLGRGGRARSRERHWAGVPLVRRPQLVHSGARAVADCALPGTYTCLRPLRRLEVSVYASHPGLGCTFQVFHYIVCTDRTFRVLLVVRGRLCFCGVGRERRFRFDCPP